MNPQQHCLQQVSKTGSSVYYACLFLTEQQRLQLAPLITLSWRLERIPRFTQEPEVVLNQFSWWQEEINQAFSGNASHLITRAIVVNSQNQESLLGYLNHLYQLQQDCQIDDSAAFLDYSLQHRGNLLQLAMESIQLTGFSELELATVSQLLSWLDVIDGFHRDARHGLIYLPLENLIEVGVTVDDITKAVADKNFLFWKDCHNQIATLYQQLWATSKRDNPLLLSIIIYASLRISAFKKSLQKTNSASNNCYNHRPTIGPLRKLWLSWTIRSRWLSGKTL